VQPLCGGRFSRDTGRVVAREETMFVGRAGELAELDRALDSTAAGAGASAGGIALQATAPATRSSFVEPPRIVMVAPVGCQEAEKRLTFQSPVFT